MPHWPKPVGYLQNEESLHRMQEVLSCLDDPHKKLQKVVHVAGTNGKGSTIAFLRAILEAEGKRVHVYNTPHILEFNERIILAGDYISDSYLHEVMERVRIASEGLDIGFYEATTAGALLAFSEVEADYLLLETGMGGRLDATNIIEAPELCIMTTIAKDHTVFLGNEISAIAGEKKHIIKRGSKCISALQYDEAFEVIEDHCAEIDVELKAFGYDFMVEKEQGLLYRSQDGDSQYGTPALLGYHQYMNAGAAIAAAKELGVSEAAIAKGVENVKWKSRLEKMDIVPHGWELYLDGAHNPAAAFALANMIEEDWQDKPTYLIYGTTQGRDTDEFLQKLAGAVGHIVLVKIQYEPNSYAAADIKFSGEASRFDYIKDAIAHITENFEEGRILCCGSLFMRGDLT